MHRRLLTFISLSLLACSSEIVRSNTGSASGAGASSSTTTSSSASHASSSSGSAAGGASGTGGGFVVSSSSGAGGHPPCDQGSIDIQGDGPDQHYPLSCPNGWGATDSPTPVGYRDSGGGAFVGLLAVDGCSTANAQIGSLFFQGNFSPGPEATNGYLNYQDQAGVTWSNDASTAFSVQLTKEAVDVGDYYDGTFKFEVTSPNAPNKAISGSFHVCRVMDSPPKP